MGEREVESNDMLTRPNTHRNIMTGLVSAPSSPGLFLSVITRLSSYRHHPASTRCAAAGDPAHTKDKRIMKPATYILASQRNGTLYVGVTSKLPTRLDEHQRNTRPNSFTARYGVHTLVWWEAHDTMEAAIAREKRLKKWPRKWKLDLIETINPDWRPLCPETGTLLASDGETQTPKL